MASGKVDDQDITVSSEENVTSKTEVNLSVEYLSFTVKSNLKDGDLYVGGTKVGTLNSGKLDVNKVEVAGSSAVYVKKNFEDGSSIKTETLPIKKIYEDQTVTLDADGVLDRDTADRLLTAPTVNLVATLLITTRHQMVYLTFSFMVLMIPCTRM